MIYLKTPAVYLHEPGALEQAGVQAAALGERALLVGGKTALEKTEQQLRKSFEQAGVYVPGSVVQGSSCTEAAVARVIKEARAHNVSLLIGAGGGSVLDTVKAAGNLLGLPVITVPTVAATCAAWSALSILYDDLGRQTETRELKYSPHAVIADDTILLHAPLRYLRAGIADTIAKWYEFAPLTYKHGHSFALRIRLDTSRLALDILERQNETLFAAVESKQVTQSFRNTVDAILFLAGLNGSIQEKGYGAAIAHMLHNSMTQLSDTHDYLHGEIVIFNLLVQFVLEGKPETEIRDFIRKILALELPVTLAQLGIRTDVEKKIHLIAVRLSVAEESRKSLPFPLDEEHVEYALRTADRIGGEERGQFSFHQCAAGNLS